LTTVSSIPFDYRIVATTNSLFTANNAEISSFDFTAEGVVTAVSSGQITLTDVRGVFAADKKIVGLSSGGTSVILPSANTPVQVNDKSAGSFETAVQLTRLVGDFTTGSTPFLEDEVIEQTSLITFAQPAGRLHHAEINSGGNNDILYISNEFGIFNLDPDGVRDISGNTSEGSFRYLSNKYKGDFVKDSGKVIYYENIDSITRSQNKSEIRKIILEF
jgi:hypothetical protein